MKGGVRAGAGRKPSPPQIAALPKSDDPVAFMRTVMNDDALDVRLRLDAAKALLSNQAKEGKKERAKREAETAEIGSEWDGLLNLNNIPAFRDFDRLR